MYKQVSVVDLKYGGTEQLRLCGHWITIDPIWSCSIEKTALQNNLYRVSQKDIVFRKIAKPLIKWPFRGAKGRNGGSH